MHIESTSIEGLLIVHLDVHGDNRGWFKENWQREKMVAAGLPDFQPVQNNISFNAARGVTRGLHAEPWDKLVSVAAGRVFGAWCDLRAGSATYGATVTYEVGPDTAVFVPYGVANGFQALEDNTAYSYLVNAHWSPKAQYTMVNLREISWPLEPTEISAKDAAHPPLADAPVMAPRRILVTGANGQLGRALRPLLPDAEFCDHAAFDITDPAAYERDWSGYWAIINCAAYNDVNGAETDRAACWETNALAPARLARVANEHNLTLVHVSSDYIFGGAPDDEDAGYSEGATPAPLSLYGASKAAGEASASVARKHYVIRTSWVFGDGANFMTTMANLARRGVDPQVVSTQKGRPTWAADLARGIVHLLDTGAEYGVYNLSSAGQVATRAEIAQAVFTELGHDPARVHPVTEYPEPARRPAVSTLDLSKIRATGFEPTDWRAALVRYY